MAYFITTKTHAHVDGSLIRVLAVRESRDLARAFAKANDGTVRTQAEFDELSQAGRVDARTVPGYVAPEVIKAEPVVTPTEPTEPPAANPWSSLAEKINKTMKVRNTLGKKEKALKRVVTNPETLAAAAAHLQAIPADTSKVMAVRIMAAWQDGEGRGIQRRDALALFAQYRDGVAAATVSTQWQLVRSGKYQAAKAAIAE